MIALAFKKNKSDTRMEINLLKLDLKKIQKQFYATL